MKDSILKSIRDRKDNLIDQSENDSILFHLNEENGVKTPPDRKIKPPEGGKITLARWSMQERNTGAA